MPPRLRISIALLAFLLFSAFARAENFESLEERLQYLYRVQTRHPNFSTLNAGWNVNPLLVMARIAKLQKNHGQHLAPMTLGADNASVLDVQYSASEPVANSEAIAGLRDQLLADLALLQSKQIVFSDLTADLQAARTAANGNGADFHRYTSALLRLSVFVYNPEGKAEQPIDADRLRKRLEAIDTKSVRTHNELANLYRDLFNAHLRKQVEALSQQSGWGMLREGTGALRAMQSGLVTNALTASTKEGGPLKSNRLRLEEVPPWVAPLVGVFGRDCSAKTVGLYRTIKGTKTYLVYKNGSTQPDGYFFVIPIRQGEKTIPYIVTSNGLSLNSPDVRAGIAAIAKDWNATQVLLPNFEHNPHVVNTDAMTQGLTLGGTEAKVKLPDGWDKIDEHYRRAGEELYYNSENLQHAQLVDLKPDTLGIHLSAEVELRKETSHYDVAQKTDLKSLPAPQRAFLAAFALESRGTTQREVLPALDVTRNQLHAARLVLAATAEEPMTPEGVRVYLKTFSVPLRDLPLNGAEAIATLGSLYYEHRAEALELNPDTKWWESKITAFEKRVAQRLLAPEQNEEGMLEDLKALTHLREWSPELWDAADKLLAKGIPSAWEKEFCVALERQRKAPLNILLRVNRLGARWLKPPALLGDWTHGDRKWTETDWRVVRALLKAESDSTTKYALYEAAMRQTEWPTGFWKEIMADLPGQSRWQRGRTFALLRSRPSWPPAVWQALTEKAIPEQFAELRGDTSDLVRDHLGAHPDDHAPIKVIGGPEEDGCDGLKKVGRKKRK